MLYVSHVQEASSSIQSIGLECFLIDSDSSRVACVCQVEHSSLIFKSHPTKSTKDANPLSTITSLKLNSRILSVHPVPSNLQHAQQDLVILTDHHNPRLLRIRASPINIPSSGQSSTQWAFQTITTLRIEHLARSPAESALELAVEPATSPRVAISHTHSGVLNVLPLSSSGSATAFSLRTPHPTLISFVLLPSTLSQPILALLSLSSTPSRIPGLGGQCLPVLSFHAIDLQSRELKPLPFGPARETPRIEEADNSSSSSLASGRDRKKSSNGPRPSGLEGEPSSSRNIPGAFDSQDADYSSSSVRQPTASTSRSVGDKAPASNGLTRSVSQERLREEKLASSPLTRAHVPLPYEDACGSHLLLALPSRINNGGSGLIIFSEKSILLVPGPNKARRASSTSSNVKGSSISGLGSPGKKRKSSVGASALSTSPTSPINASASILALATSPPNSRQNENGKRRRSSVKGSGAPTSPEISRSSGGNRIQIYKMQDPMQVISSVVVSESGDSGESQVTSDGLSTISEDGRSSLKILFATHSGLLYLLSIDLEGEGRIPIGMNVSLLGDIPAPGGPHGLEYLGESLLHVSSASGDSVLVKIESEPQPRIETSSISIPSSTSSYLTTVTRRPNLAPIMDFVVDDGAGGDPTSTSSAQARILTCSGAGPTGSIRSVRNGVSISELFSLSLDSISPLSSIEKLWHIQDTSSNSRFLVLGDIEGATKWLEFENGGIQEVSGDLQQLNSIDQKGSLAIQSLEGGKFVQVSKCSVVVADLSSANPIADQWLASSLQSEITAASVNKAGQVLVSLRGGKVVYLEISQSSGSIQMQKQVDFEHEVSSLDISSLDPNGVSQTEASAIGFWGLNKIKILSIPSLEDVTPSSISSQKPLESLPVSILLHTFSQVDSQGKLFSSSSPHLLVGLGNGTLHSYSLSLPTKDSFSKAIGVNDKKVITLGNTSVKLEKFQTDEGRRSVWCNSDRSAVLFSENSSGGDRLTYSSTKFRDTKSIASLSMEGGTQTILALAVADQIHFLTVGAIQKLDIKTVEFGNENPLAIASHSNAGDGSTKETTGHFATVTWRFEALGKETRIDEPGGKVWLLSREELNVLHSLPLPKNHRPNCIESVRLMDQDCLAIGTGQVSPDQEETLSGMILLFKVVSSISEGGVFQPKLEFVHSQEVSGNVYALAQVEGKLIAAVNSQVVSLKLIPHDNDTLNLSPGSQDSNPIRFDKPVSDLWLERVGDWNSGFVACTLSVCQNSSSIVVGDALRALTVLKVLPSGRLIDLARDCDPYWTTAAISLDEENMEFIGSDVALNMWTSQRSLLSQNAIRKMREERDRKLGRGEKMDVDDDEDDGQEGKSKSSNRIQVPEEDEKWSHVLNKKAGWHYGDMINKFRHGALVPTSANPHSSSGFSVKPCLVFCTAAGAIGIVASTDKDSGKLLTEVERNLREVIKPIGDLPYEEYRTLRTDHRQSPPAGFIDGDFLQRFTSLSVVERNRVLQGPNSQNEKVSGSTEEVIRLVEELGRLT